MCTPGSGIRNLGCTPRNRSAEVAAAGNAFGRWGAPSVASLRRCSPASTSARRRPDARCPPRRGRWPALLPRPRVDGDEPVAAVRRILAAVRAGGDAAVRDLTEELDGVRLAELTVPQDELKAALDRIPDDLREALTVAAAHIEAYHRTQREQPAALEQDGISIRSMAVPVDRAGCYVPGGRARYPSTVLMTALVAKVAGVPHVALGHPARPGRAASPTRRSPPPRWPAWTRSTAIGGAQAIAALAYGTESIEPGRRDRGAGQRLRRHRQAGGGAGGARRGALRVRRSERGRRRRRPVRGGRLRGDRRHRPGRARAGRVGLVDLVGRGRGRRRRPCRRSPHRDEPPPRTTSRPPSPRAGTPSSSTHPRDAIAVSNAIAPEHLELMVADPEALVPLVRHAGAVFTGAVVAGQRGRLRGRPVARAPHVRLGPLRPGADRGRLHQARPRRPPGRGRRCARSAAM